jgi:hypothetical protein
MTKVRGWLELYLWMNEQRQVEINTNSNHKTLVSKEKRTIASDLKNSVSNPKSKEQKHGLSKN